MTRAERLALALDRLGPSLWTPLASQGALLSAGIPSQLTASGPPWWLLARYEVQVVDTSEWQPQPPPGARFDTPAQASTKGALDSRLTWLDRTGAVVMREQARVVASAQRPSRIDETGPLRVPSGAWACEGETVTDYCTTAIDLSAVHRAPVDDPDAAVVVPGLLVVGLALATHASELPIAIAGMRARFLRPVFTKELLISSAAPTTRHGVQVRVVGLDGRTRAIAQLEPA